MTRPFDASAAYYDLLYRDKDYQAEAAYLAEHLRIHAPDAQKLLELGCGTAGHAARLAAMGFNVDGIDLSEAMLERARATIAALPTGISSRIRLESGDVRNWRGGCEYDAVLSLFHVFSYQCEDADIDAAFRTAALHLRPGGFLLIDFWYGPAVEALGPESRTRRIESGSIRILRKAVPNWLRDRNIVEVRFEVEVEDLSSGTRSSFEELHRMRYFSREELVERLHTAGLEAFAFREWLADREPTEGSWSAMLVARKPG